MAEPDGFSHLGGAEGGGEHRLHVHILRGAWISGRGVLVHHLREEILVERAPVHADAHGLVVIDGNLDDRTKVLIPPLAAHVPRVDAVLGKRTRAVRMPGEQQVAIVVKVSDDRHGHTKIRQPTRDLRDRRGRLVVVHRDAH